MHVCRGTFSGLGMAALCPSLPGSRFGPVSDSCKGRLKTPVLTLRPLQR